MTSNLGFYIKPKVLHSPTFEEDDDNLFDNDEDDQDGYLQEVPYTSSSSIDRSSIGSIPWSDEAIKLNQAEWERVEKMLSGQENNNLPTEDEDLRKEIVDWRKKFPQLVGRNLICNMKTLSSDTLELESLNLSSDEGDLYVDDNHTLTRDSKQNKEEDLSVTPTPTIRKSSEEDNANLCDMLQNFTLTSVPLKLNERDKTQKPFNIRKCASSSSSYSHSPPTPVNVPISQASTATQRLRMPPILNVLESTRKFRSLGRHQANPSFVQLTQVQQAKSAVVTQGQKSRSIYHAGHRSAWHVPLAANRFFNNRNSIILPAISSRQHTMHQYNSQPTTISSSSSGLNNITPLSARGHFIRTNADSFKPSSKITTAKRDMMNGSMFSTTASSQTNTSNSLRSISAAVHYQPQRSTFNALYLPYSASKFHVFK